MHQNQNDIFSSTENLPQLNELPDNFTAILDNVSAISLSGEEKEKYLQGQVTCDVNTLDEQKLLVGGHCDAKGKVLSIFRLLQKQQELLMLQPNQTIEKSLTELKKFGVFAKVDIKHSPLAVLACFGEKISEHLKAIFPVLPDELSPAVTIESTTIVYISGQQRRYLVIDNAEAISKVQSNLSLPSLPSQVWNLIEITEGFPILTESAVQHFVPQMLNLDAIGGISFNKGCYLGQETVARMQYLGKNKKAMTILTGHVDSTTEDLAIEKQLGDNWRSAGDNLGHYISHSGLCYLQAVVASDLDKTTKLRFKHQPSSNLTMMALPYSTQSPK